MEAQAFDTKPLYRPDQLQSAKEEIKSLEHKLSNPLIQDKAEVGKQLRRARHMLELQAPKPPATAEEEGRMVARSKQLLGEILEGMPSQEEMRKAPPGAVDKHMGWEKRNKLRILEYKNLQLRLNPGERDAANLERHRPRVSTLLMDNAQIQGRQFHMPETSGPSVVFNDAQIALLRQLSPQLADMLALMPNTDRQQVKNSIAGIGLAEEVQSAASVAGHKGAAKKRQMSQAQKDAMKAGREAAAAKKAKA